MSDSPKKDAKARFRDKLRRTMLRNDLKDSFASLIRLYVSATLDAPVTREHLHEIWEEALLQVKISE